MSRIEEITKDMQGQELAFIKTGNWARSLFNIIRNCRSSDEAMDLVELNDALILMIGDL